MTGGAFPPCPTTLYKTKIDPPTPGGSIVCFYLVTGYQLGLIQQKALLAGGKAAVAGQKLALIVLGGGLVAKQIVDADPKIIRNAPQGIIVRLASALYIVSQGGRRKQQLGRQILDFDFFAIYQIA